jgi:DNA mismatch repair protein MutS2
MRIAARLGLPRRVVEAAETAMRGGFEMDRETLLIRLEEEHTRLADARATGEQRARDLELELETARRDREKLAARERENATAELRELRRDVERMRDELARQLRAASQAPATPGQAPVQNADADRVLEEARRISKAVEQRTREAEEKRRAEQQSHRVGVDVAKLVAGASVFVRPFGREGQVVEAPRPGERVLVQIGGMRASFTLDDLATGSGSTAVETRMATRTRSADYDGAAVSMTLDLRGANAEDALEQLDLYLDRAWRAGLPSATIIHGHGTGVLKRAIRQRLPKAPWSVSQRPGQREEGGDGVTMVEFKTRSADLDSE